MMAPLITVIKKVSNYTPSLKKQQQQIKLVLYSTANYPRPQLISK